MTKTTFSFHSFNPPPGFTWKMEVDGEIILAIRIEKRDEMPVVHDSPGLTVPIGKTPFTIGGTWRDVKARDTFVEHELIMMRHAIADPALQSVS